MVERGAPRNQPEMEAFFNANFLASGVTTVVLSCQSRMRSSTELVLDVVESRELVDGRDVVNVVNVVGVSSSSSFYIPPERGPGRIAAASM